MLYISGQLPLNPTLGKIEATEINGQAEQVFENINAILTAAGYTFADEVKSTDFLSEIADFAGMNEVNKKFYQTECPARFAFTVKTLPLGALVEVETIAAK